MVLCSRPECQTTAGCHCVSPWEGRRGIDWRLGVIDRRRAEIMKELADLDRQERDILSLTT